MQLSRLIISSNCCIARIFAWHELYVMTAIVLFCLCQCCYPCLRLCKFVLHCTMISDNDAMLFPWPWVKWDVNGLCILFYFMSVTYRIGATVCNYCTSEATLCCYKHVLLNKIEPLPPTVHLVLSLSSPLMQLFHAGKPNIRRVQTRGREVCEVVVWCWM